MLFCNLRDHCEILRVIRHNRYLDLGNGLNKGTTDLLRSSLSSDLEHGLTW